MSRPSSARAPAPRRAEAGSPPACFPARAMVVPRLPLPGQTSFDAGAARHAARGPWPADAQTVSHSSPPAFPWFLAGSPPPSPGTPGPAASSAPGPLAASTRAGYAPARAAAEPPPAPAADPEGPRAAGRRRPPALAPLCAPAGNSASRTRPASGPPLQGFVPRLRLPGWPRPAAAPAEGPPAPGPKAVQASGGGCEPDRQPSLPDVT